MPADDTLGSTLSNLGTSLSQALNPMNMIRAQDIQAQVQQRQWEIQQQQRIDAANQNAATVYRNANPFNEDPASLEVSANNIASGHADLGKSIDAVKAIGGWQANQKAAALYAAAHPELPPDQLASDQAELIAGRKSASELANDRATAALGVNKATATIGATSAAQGATSGPNAALAGAAAAGGDETGASKLIAQGNELTAPVISGSLTDPNVQAQIDKRRTQQAVAGTTPPAGAPVSSGLAAPTAVADITGKNIVAQSAPRAPTAIVPAVPPTDVLTGQPVTVAPGAAPPPGVISQTAQGPNTAATAASTAASTAADEGTKFRAGEVTADIASGTKALTLLRTVALMRQYANLLDNDTPLNQFSQHFTQAVKNELGITLDENQSARTAFEQLGNTLIASVRGDDGIIRTAGPELQFFAKALPNAAQDRNSLNAALDQLEIKARNLSAVGDEARQVYGVTGGNVDAKNFVDYTNRKNQILRPPTADKPAGTPDTSAPLNQPPKKPAPGGARIWVPNADGTFSAHPASQ